MSRITKKAFKAQIVKEFEDYRKQHPENDKQIAQLLSLPATEALQYFSQYAVEAALATDDPITRTHEHVVAMRVLDSPYFPDMIDENVLTPMVIRKYVLATLNSQIRTLLMSAVEQETGTADRYNFNELANPRNTNTPGNALDKLLVGGISDIQLRHLIITSLPENVIVLLLQYIGLSRRV